MTEAQKFANAVIAYVGRPAMIRYDRSRDIDRIAALVQQIEYMCRAQICSSAQDAASYGLAMAVRSGRTNAYASDAVYKSDFRLLCKLVYELSEKVEHGEYAAYLNAKFTPKDLQEGIPQNVTL